MPTLKDRVPAVDGWFTMDDAPALLGSRCAACGTYTFPPDPTFCRNPACDGRDFEIVPLSRRGRIWSFTDNRYQPPAPYVSADPFVPYAIAAVELSEERMVVLGQLDGSIDGVAVGQEVEVVLGTLFEDDDHTYVVWKWRPRPSGGEREGTVA